MAYRDFVRQGRTTAYAQCIDRWPDSFIDSQIHIFIEFDLHAYANPKIAYLYTKIYCR